MGNHNTNLIVINHPGTGGDKCPAGHTWLEHWYVNTGSKRTMCAVNGCSNPVQVGAHVTLTDGRRSDDIFIAPICRACNIHHNESPMELSSHVSIVRADACE